MNDNIIIKTYRKLKDIFGVLLDPIVAIIFALSIGAIIIGGLGYDVSLAYGALFEGAFGNIRNISQTLLSATPLLFTGLAFAFAYRCGLFNIGVEGQLYLGACIGGWVGYIVTGLPPLIHIPLVLIVGGIAGAAWGFLPGFLKAKLGVHEVINTIMMSHIAINLTNWLVSSEGPFRYGSTLPAIPYIKPSAQLPFIISGTNLTASFFIGIVIAVLIWIILFKSKLGYRIRAVGHNPFASKSAGINSKKHIIYTMLIAGAIAGIGGAMEIISVHGRFYAGFSPGYGYTGIAVAMLGSNHPVAIVFSALLFGAIKNGSTSMQMIAGTNADLVKVLQALIIFFIAGKWSVKFYLEKIKKDKIPGLLSEGGES